MEHLPNSVKTLEVCKSLVDEHRAMEKELDILEKKLNETSEEQRLSDEQWAKMDQHLTKIFNEMNCHFACEEKALFPVLDNYHPMVLMEVEHDMIYEIRNAFEKAFKRSKTDLSQNKWVRESGLKFIEELRDHIGREDHGIFPPAENEMSDDEKLTVIKKMEKIKEAAEIKPESAPHRPDRNFSITQLSQDSANTKPISIETHFKTEHLEVKQLSLKAGESLAKHWSPHRLLIHVVSGEGFWESAEQKTVMTAGTLINADPQLEHAIHATSDLSCLIFFESVPRYQ